MATAVLARRAKGRLPKRVGIAYEAIEDMIANFDVIASDPLTVAQRRALGEARQSVQGFAVGILYPFLVKEKP